MKRFRENIHTLLFATCALAVIAYEGKHFLAGEKLDDHTLLLFGVNLLALLALVILAERLLESSSKREFAAFSEEMRILIREMQKSVGILFVEGQQKIYIKAAALFADATTSIKMLIMEVAAPAPLSFGEKLANFLLEHPGVTCDVVIAVAQPDENFWLANDERLKLYQERGLIGRQLFIYIVEVSTPIGFNVAVVDNRHGFIAFPPIPATGQSAEAAIIFDNRPKIAAKLE